VPGAGRFEIGDVETSFSIQSVSKPFVFALVCEAIGHGEARRRLGVNSTGFPFDSLMAVELNVDQTMATAGLYELSGDWLYEIGVPGRAASAGPSSPCRPARAAWPPSPHRLMRQGKASAISW
jgi:glutaminase